MKARLLAIEYFLVEIYLLVQTDQFVKKRTMKFFWFIVIDRQSIWKYVQIFLVRIVVAH